MNCRDKEIRNGTTVMRRALFLFACFALISQMTFAGQITASIYNSSASDQEPNVSVEFEDALHLLARKVNVGISDNTAMMPPKKEKLALSSIVQTGELAGTVTDATGEPLPGANVYIEATGQGASTDADGEFQIFDIETGTYEVSVTFIGYEEFVQEVEILEGQTTEVEFELKQKTSQLDEVVVTGYGTRERSQATGAISAVSAEDFENRTIQTADEALQGNATGFNMVSTSGQPGGDSFIRIRGMGSISAGGDPLYIVDGTRLENSYRGTQASTNILQSINPNDIASIEVLKDAEATSIYGADGANGVILITTKSGVAGETQFSASYQGGVSEQTYKYPVMSGPNFVRSMMEAYGNRAVDLGNPRQEGEQEAIDEFGHPDEVGTYDWYGELLRPGAHHVFNLSANGGSENTQFYISLGYNDEEGTVKSSKFSRMSLRANINHQATDRLSFDLKTNLARTKGTGQADQQGFSGGSNWINSPFHGGVTTRITSPIYNEDGSYNQDPGDLAGVSYNNVQLVEVGEERIARLSQLIGSLSATYDFNDNFSFRSRYNLDYRVNRDYRFNNPVVDRYAQYGGSVYQRTREVASYNIDQVLDYQNTFDEYHVLNVLVGGEYQHMYREHHNVTGEELPSSLFNTVNATATNATIGGTFAEYKKAGLFTRAEYSYDERYNINGTLRYDGSSRFGEDNRFGLFYSAGVSWDMAAETFMDDVDFVEQISWRLSYGTTGNSNIGNYAHRTFFGTGGSYDGATGLRPTQLGISTLSWEIARTLDLGVDWSLFQDRFYGTFSVYRKNNEDLLLDRTLPNHSGFGSLQDNVGTVRNQGVEVEIGGVLLEYGDFSWSSEFNITYEHNEIIELVEGQESIGNTTRVGHPVDIRWGNYFAGVNPADGRPMWYDEDGNLTYTVTDNDDGVIGSPLPDYYGGLSTQFNYGPVSLDVLFHYSYGQDLAATQYDIFYLQPHRGRVLSTEMFERWQEPGDMTHIPRMYSESAFPGGTYYGEFDTRRMQDGSFIRLKNINLQYHLPVRFLETINLDRVSVFVQGENLITWTEFEGPDPEVPEQNQSYYPTPRTISGGISVDF